MNYVPLSTTYIMSELELTTDNFDKKVLQSDKPVLVDLWAPWCGPCQMLGPIIQELAEELGDKITVAKLNVGEHRELAIRYQVQGIPTVILFNNGEEVARVIGVRDKEFYMQLIEENLS